MVGWGNNAYVLSWVLLCSRRDTGILGEGQENKNHGKFGQCPLWKQDPL